MPGPFFLSFAAFFLAVFGYAVVRGGAPERWTAAIFLGGWLATLLVMSPYGDRYMGIEWGILTVDTMMLAGLAAVALRAHRIWPLPVVSIQALIVLGHFGKLLGPSFAPLVYAANTIGWSIAQIAILGVATYLHARARRLRPTVPSWSNYSRRLTQIEPMAGRRS